MKSSAAIAALAVFSYSTAILATDEQGSAIRPALIATKTEERPFGGPPPGNREIRLKKAGKKCATAVNACDLSKARAVGTLCKCPEGDDKGVQGKVGITPIRALTTSHPLLPGTAQVSSFFLCYHSPQNAPNAESSRRCTSYPL